MAWRSLSRERRRATYQGEPVTAQQRRRNRTWLGFMRNVTTTEHLRLNLARNGPKSLAEILQDHPELAGQAYAADVVLLLLQTRSAFSAAG